MECVSKLFNHNKFTMVARRHFNVFWSALPLRNWFFISTRLYPHKKYGNLIKPGSNEYSILRCAIYGWKRLFYELYWNWSLAWYYSWSSYNSSSYDPRYHYFPSQCHTYPFASNWHVCLFSFWRLLRLFTYLSSICRYGRLNIIKSSDCIHFFLSIHYIACVYLS